ncbi:hypothetical protein [Bifidobacterium vansinderenii]|uniref:Uncharacterized protein n=1 Tax=Bifidobacterium vansinderenii TaxID=1984871 RepID=A0A229W197_9BIFI|nr:hypothetical protein [Bifidobacterium vansinderenii]OXN01628.1 hypothetical protein Tam10B_0070 [Bifidobacterium vansinderenii]
MVFGTEPQRKSRRFVDLERDLIREAVRDLEDIQARKTNGTVRPGPAADVAKSVIHRLGRDLDHKGKHGTPAALSRAELIAGNGWIPEAIHILNTMIGGTR